MIDIKNYIKEVTKIDYPKVCELLIHQFGVNQNVNWEAILPVAQQKELFGAELLRNIVELPQRIDQHEIRAISLLKGEISQLLFFFVKLNDEQLHKTEILQLARRFHRGQLAQNYIIWFVGNKSESKLKIVVVGKEGKKIKLKILPLEVGNWFKTYDLILNEVNNKFNTDGLFQNLKEPANLWKALWDSFDISIINKHFYLGIHQYFKQIVLELAKNERLFKEQNTKEQFAIRLIGRIIFCWFLKKKEIIKENVLSSDTVTKTDDYYNKYLSVLFFEVFNTPKANREDIPMVFKDYPYLNGGLFEPQTDDYYKVEDGYFYIKIKIEDSVIENFFKFLESYNFTVDENSSANSEIAIDPEMLGRIFENLLAEQNPETGETARKSTGSYYTPREIVEYMVEESIIQYLKTKLLSKNLSVSERPDSVLNEEYIEDFVRTEFFNEGTLKAEEKNKIKDLIYKTLCEIKILDPACGSGAFPIGMLQKIVTLKQLCYTKKDEKKGNADVKISAKGLRKGFQIIEKKETSPNYQLKLETLQNSIFGVDIQPLATELSRLRSWLTLIVEEDNQNIQPLPNLDFKFVTANTLIGIGLKEYYLQNSEKLVFKEVEDLIKKINELQNIRLQYFDTATPDGFVTKLKPDKQKLKIEFEELQKEILALSAKIYLTDPKIGNIAQTIFQWNPFDDKSVAPFFDELWMFGLLPEKTNEKNQSVEIEIFNKQIDSLNSQIESINLSLGAKKIDKILKLKFNTANQQIKILEIEIENINNKINELKGTIDKKVKNIVSEPIDATYSINSLNTKIKELNLKIENLSKELKPANYSDLGVFDIVIGNPPYVDIKALPKNDVKEYFKLFQTTENRINLYSIFVEKGINLLKPDGKLTFIMPNSILINESYKKIRKFIVDGVEKIIKLPDSVFEAATVETIILISGKNINDKNIKGVYFSKNDKMDFGKLIFNNFQREDWKKDKDSRFNIFSNNNILKILMKIENSNKYLEDFILTSLGITPYDKYKGHSPDLIKKREFHSKIKISELYVPLISGKNIQRFYISDEIEEYLNYGHWLGAPRDKKFFENSKIIIRQIVGGNELRIIGGYSEKPNYFTQIGFSIIPKENCILSLKYILCILNSKLMSFYHKHKFLDIEKVVFQKILIANCKKFPIPEISEKEQKPFIELVDKILEKKKNGEDTTKEEREIDKMIYQLYELTDVEIAIIEGKNN